MAFGNLLDVEASIDSCMEVSIQNNLCDVMHTENTSIITRSKKKSNKEFVVFPDFKNFHDSEETFASFSKYDNTQCFAECTICCQGQ